MAAGGTCGDACAGFVSRSATTFSDCSVRRACTAGSALNTGKSRVVGPGAVPASNPPVIDAECPPLKAASCAKAASVESAAACWAVVPLAPNPEGRPIPASGGATVASATWATEAPFADATVPCPGAAVWFAPDARASPGAEASAGTATVSRSGAPCFSRSPKLAASTSAKSLTPLSPLPAAPSASAPLQQQPLPKGKQTLKLQTVQ